ncbi:MAG: O-antigen ligase family protein [Phycisphaerales bacterium]
MTPTPPTPPTHHTQSPQHPPAQSLQNRSTSIVAVLSLLGFMLAASGAVLHAVTTFAPFPGWDLDPLIFPIPHTGLGPGRSMLVDLAIQLGCVLILGAEWLAGRRVRWELLGLLLVGAVVMWVGSRRAEADGETSSSWIAAMTLGVTMMHACRSPRLRCTVLAIFLTIVVMFAVRAAQEVFIEHPETIATFRASKQRVFESQGWQPDSPMARSYTRRIEQSDASAWFGLSNVLATFAAGGATCAGVLLVLVARRWRGRDAAQAGQGPRRANAIVGATLLLLASLVALALCQAKGGVAALALGLTFALAATMVRRRRARSDRPWLGFAGPVLSLGALASVFALVIANALLGEKGELSLLFRWFYLKAAAKVGLLDAFGCGPGGFQPFYSIYKDPLSPEDVSSAHNVFMDYWAAGGVLALAWIALWLIWIARAGSTSVSLSAAPPPPAPSAPDEGFRWEHIEPAWCLRVVVGVVVIATLIAMTMEQPILTLDLGMVRIIGIAAAGLVGWFVILRLPRGIGEEQTDRAARCSLAAGAVAMGAHALIDQTAVWPGSASLLLMVIGAAGAFSYSPSQASATIRRRRPDRIASAVGIALLAPVALTASRTTPRERLLVSAARTVAPLQPLTSRFAELMSRPPSPEQTRLLDELAVDIGNELPGIIPATPESIQQNLLLLERRRLESATDKLLSAARVGNNGGRPRDFKSLREASHLQVILAQRSLDRRDIPDAVRRLDLALKWSRARIGADPPAPTRVRPVEYGWLALMHQTRHDMLSTVGRADEADLRAAADAAEQGAALDPYNLEFPKRLMRLAVALHDPQSASKWARKLLELDALKRLDAQAQGLSPDERIEAGRLAGAS